MKSLKTLLANVTLVLCITACQKEYILEDIVPTTPPDSMDDITYIDKVYQIDSTSGSLDSSFIASFYYDGDKRLTREVDSIYDNNGKKVLWATYVYSYNGTDTLPLRLVYEDMELTIGSGDPNLKGITTTWYQFDTVGRNLYDSTVTVYPTAYSFRNGTVVRKYQYNGSMIYGMSSEALEINGGIIDLYRDTAQLDAKGNVLISKKYKFQNGTYLPLFTSTFTYDNNPNPFARISSYKTAQVFASGETTYGTMQAKNNRLKALETDGTSVLFDEDLTGKYIYNNNSYPMKLTLYQPNVPGLYLLAYFTYKAL